MDDPSRLQVEYLILVEDYLNEMPSVLDAAVKKIGELSRQLNTNYGSYDHTKKDIDYLKEKSKVLKDAARSSRQLVRLISGCPKPPGAKHWLS